MPKYDPRDPVYHDVGGEKAEASILRRFKRWLSHQPKSNWGYFCQHGSYVGYHGALSFMCKGCSGANSV